MFRSGSNYVGLNLYYEQYFDTYDSSWHVVFRWSRNLITGPHLSGLEFLGHIVTVGNATFLIGTTRVFDFTGSVYQATKKPNFICLGNAFKLIYLVYNIKTYRIQQFSVEAKHTLSMWIIQVTKSIASLQLIFYPLNIQTHGCLFAQQNPLTPQRLPSFKIRYPESTVKLKRY